MEVETEMTCVEVRTASGLPAARTPSRSQRALAALAALLVLVTVPAGRAFAQITGHPIDVYAGGGLFAYDIRSGLRDSYAVSGGLGFRLATWATLEGSATYGRTEPDGLPGVKQSLLDGSLDLRLDMRPAEGRIVPFFIAGVGDAREKGGIVPNGSESIVSPSLGLGGLFDIAGRQEWYARIQVRDLMIHQKETLEFTHNVAVTVGLEYLWGHKYRDQDLDKVRDWLDKCPDTPIGATVDATGCPKDSDGDGVLDGIDKCPNTPKGAKVDATGCPIDSDADGVPDGIDKCPDTPKGAKVDATGCPIDSDADGVPDGLDQCPDTPKACKVDDKGCPLDADGDGVCDAMDKCPNTPKNAQVDADGCETSASKLEGDLLDTGEWRLLNVKFAGTTAELDPTSYKALDDAAQVIAVWPEVHFEIGVHVDAPKHGSARELMKLTAARADAVRAYLLHSSKSIAPDHLVAKGYGSTKPLASNDTEVGRTLNRRVEIVALDKGAIVKANGAHRLGAKSH